MGDSDAAGSARLDTRLDGRTDVVHVRMHIP
jgi:hypothetical protein